MTGLVSKEERVKISGLTGATHIEYYNFYYNYNKNKESYDSIDITRKLIDIETGETLAVLSLNVEY